MTNLQEFTFSRCTWIKLHNFYKISFTLTIIVGLRLATSQPAAAATLYSVTNLGTLGGDESSASGINDLGQVVGNSRTASYDFHPFRTAPSSPINPTTDDIGSFFNSDFTTATGINNLGQVTGYESSEKAVGPAAFRTAPNSPINAATDDLGSLNGSVTLANGINNLGQVVGESFNGNRLQAFRTAPESPINPTTDDIGTLGSNYSSANGINDLGQVVGSLGTAHSQTHAFRTAPESPINPKTDDIGTLGGDYSTANGINNLGQVVGNSTTAHSQTHAFRTAPESPINPKTDDIGTLGGDYSTATGINNLGQIVGYSTTAENVNHAFIYNDNKLFDLNNLLSPGTSFIITSANAINQRGQIAADGFSSNEAFPTKSALLLTPFSTPVPEPSSALGTLAFGAFGAGYMLKRKQKKKEHSVNQKVL